MNNNIQISDFKNYFFLGIGGIGMSAIARYFNHLGKTVLGYDKTPTSLTNKLIEEGIEITFDDSSEIVNRQSSIINPQDTLIIFTPAIPKDSILFNYFIDNRFFMLKRSRVLGLITEQTNCFAVAGTHGKTTTSTLLAHLCYDSNQKVSAFLGGISENYNTNFLFNGNEISVLEADEFDRSFLNLHPDIACITSTDADHLDIYGESSEVIKSFESFADLVPANGKVFVQKDININRENSFTYSSEGFADYYPTNIRIDGFKTTFDYVYPKGKIKDLEYHFPGKHNLENATVAIAMALELEIEENNIKQALRTFKGIKRRFNGFEISENRYYIDDYAHHPTEINACLSTVNQLFKGKKILTIFQPHLYSRTRDFIDEFAKSLEQTTELILLDIYPARELPIEGITSEVLFDKIKLEKKELCSLDEAVEKIKTKNFDVVVTLGAGNIDTLIEKIKLI
ncbi:MAG: UDP-N-acetylmuramate--L-alanine ligase [Flavobacteriales bacterium]|nr:UDP-N-acetylmuramate--L-alanine ligase [Flavobacteriales bacterium]